MASDPDLVLSFRMTSGSRFDNPSVDRGTISLDSPAELAAWFEGRDSEQLFLLAHLRSESSGAHVFVARADTYWWAYRNLGIVFTSVTPPEGPPTAWRHLEMPEPFWGAWDVLPFWAATSLEKACGKAWVVLNSEDGAQRVECVRIPLEEFATEPRHKRAHDEGAAILADWDAIDQEFPKPQ